MIHAIPYALGRCGAVFWQDTLFDSYVRVCNREPHEDHIHHDGTGTWSRMPRERHMSDYTCNAVTKNKGRIAICELQLDHQGDHKDGELTWEPITFDDEDSPPIW